MSGKPILQLEFDKITHHEKRERVFFGLKIIILLALIYIRTQYFEPESDENLEWPQRVVESLIMFVTAYLLISLSRLVLVYFYVKKNRQQTDFIDNFILGINRIASLLTFFALIISVFVFLDINLRDFFTSISIVAAAIALLSKDYISNMINGMIIMFSDQLSLNDDVKIGDQKGKVVDITLINVHLLNDNEDLVYIPNSTIFNSNVINYTKYNINKITMEFELGRRQMGTINDLEDFIKSDLSSYQHLIEDDSLHIRVSKITRDHVLLKLQFVLLSQATKLEGEIRNQVAMSVLKYADIDKTDIKYQ